MVIGSLSVVLIIVNLDLWKEINEKLFIITIILLLQSFNSFCDLNGKGIYCKKQKHLFFNSNKKLSH